MAATATQPRSSAPPQPAPAKDAGAQWLEKTLAEWSNPQTGRAAKYRALHVQLDSRVQQLERVLPASLRSQAARLIERAMLYWKRRPELDKCTPESFLQCVVDAAELGLLVDGRLAYAVPYKGKAQLIVSYKGLVAVARRSGLVKDCFAEIVRWGEPFEFRVVDGRHVLNHEPNLDRKEDDKILGAYAVVTLPDGTRRPEWMSAAELDRIQSASAANKAHLPWGQHRAEMRKKTVLRRILKLFEEDPGLGRALELEEVEHEDDAPAEPRKPAAPVNLRRPADDFGEEPQTSPAKERARELGDVLDNASDEKDIRTAIADIEAACGEIPMDALERLRRAGAAKLAGLRQAGDETE